MNTSYDDAVLAGVHFRERARAMGEGAAPAAQRLAFERTVTERASDERGTRERTTTERVTAPYAEAPAGPFHLPTAPAGHARAPCPRHADPTPLYERREQELRLALDGRAADARAVEERAIASAAVQAGATGAEGSALRDLLASQGIFTARDLMSALDPYGLGAYGNDPYGSDEVFDPYGFGLYGLTGRSF